MLGVGVRDFVIIAVALVLGLLTLFEFLSMRSVTLKLRGAVSLSPSVLDESMVAGGELRRSIEVFSTHNLKMKFSSPLKFLRVDPEWVNVRKSSLDLVFHPHLAGDYSSSSVGVVTSGRLGLIHGETSLFLSLHFSVYPRVFPVAVEAMESLYGMGGLGSGTAPLQLRGSGLEYAESREYVPGDPLNVFDWKATARLRRFIVKEHFVEGGQSLAIYYEPSAPDGVSLDELSSVFLKTVLSYSRMQMPLDILVSRKRGDLTVSRELSPRDALECALRLVLAGREQEFMEYYSVLEPKCSKYAVRLFAKPELKGFDRSGLMDVAFFLGDEERDLLIVSCLSGDPVPLIELVERCESSVYLVQPTRPWLWAHDLEDSILVWNNYDRIYRALMELGVSVSGSVEEFFLRSRVRPSIFLPFEKMIEVT